MIKQTYFILLVVSFCFGCDNTDQTDRIDIRFMTGEQSGAWPALAVGITEIMKKEVSVLGNVSILPGGGISNVMGVDRGKADLGFSQAASIVDAINGNPPFDEKAEDFSYVISLFPHKTHIVTPQSTGINSINDIRGKRINVGANGLLSEYIARQILEIHGMHYEDMASVQNLSFSDSVVQMKDGLLDVLFWTVPAPFAVLTDLSQSEDVKFIALPETTIQKLSLGNIGLGRAEIEKGTYRGLEHDVSTVQSPLVIISNNNTSDEIIYQMTRIIFENLQSLTSVSSNLKGVKEDELFQDYGIPYHPGARRYYEQISRR